MDLVEKNKNGITREDIQRVANDLTIGMTVDQLTEVWNEYDNVIEDYDKSDNWSSVVEDLIYNL